MDYSISMNYTPPTKKIRLSHSTHSSHSNDYFHFTNTRGRGKVSRNNGDGIENRNTLNHTHYYQYQHYQQHHQQHHQQQQQNDEVSDRCVATQNNKGEDIQSLSLNNQPVAQLQLVLTFLHFIDLKSLRLVNGLFYDLVTRSKQCIEQRLYKYSKIPLVKTPSIYSIKLFNQNMASILYKSYYNFIEDNLNTIKRRSRSLPVGHGIDSNFELIDKDDIIPLNIYDESQSKYFKQLRQIFDELSIWNEMVSIIFNPKLFNKFCLFHNTTIFQAYSRLLSYNFMSQFPNDIRSNQS